MIRIGGQALKEHLVNPLHQNFKDKAKVNAKCGYFHNCIAKKQKGQLSKRDNSIYQLKNHGRTGWSYKRVDNHLRALWRKTYTNTDKLSSQVESLRRLSEKLTLLHLSKKVVTLMALCNAEQCSDLAALDQDYVRWISTGVQLTAVQLTNTQKAGPTMAVLYAAVQDDPAGV